MKFEFFQNLGVSGVLVRRIRTIFDDGTNMMCKLVVLVSYDTFRGEIIFLEITISSYHTTRNLLVNCGVVGFFRHEIK